MQKKGSSWEKWGAASVTLLLAASLLGACSGGDNVPANSRDNGSAPSAGTAGNKDGAAAEPREPIVIKWMPLPGNLTDNSYAQTYMEAKFGVTIEPYIIPDGYMEKQQILLGSNDIPDIFYVPDPQYISRYAAQGLLAEVSPEVIEAHAPDTFKMLNAFAPQAWYYSNYDGANYGLPTVYYTGQYNTKQLWRDDLLRQVGIDTIPVTLEEIEAAFAALKEIGVYGMTTNGHVDYNQFHSIFGAFGVMPIQWMERDGKVVNGATQPEAREALALLADWFAKGYIDPEFVTGQELETKLVNGKVAFYDSGNNNALDPDNPNSVISKIKQLNPEGSIAFGELPKGPGGQHGWAWGTGGHIWAFGRQLEDEPEKLAKILEMINTIQNDEETFLALAWGEEGKHWAYHDPERGAEGGLKRLPPYDDGAKLQAEGLRDSGLTTEFANQGNPALFEKFTAKETLEQQKLYASPMSDLFGKAGVLPSAGQYWGDLSKLKIEAYTAIIYGNEPIAYFDEFVRQWNELGGAQLEQEANELYAQMQQ
ncbi:hypothetical protein IDH44_00525 [Paenibacillus sp. IB182496]|uniref:Extracellular solute-binding protein n=1 Tax=Paenibacillus sabuli TaxID=2772509 RepID=A0A927BN87_9BACL|nr:extracellular solute-binding protein [Paenibacillus sabuli]MBD2843658.1 hypothetical protein [Paenibacillus sabuli]